MDRPVRGYGSTVELITTALADSMNTQPEHETTEQCMQRHLGHITHVARDDASFSVGVFDDVVGDPGPATVRRPADVALDYVAAVGMGGEISFGLANRPGEENGR